MTVTTVDVTADDIRHGVQAECEECPFALALLRILRPGTIPAVRNDYVTLYEGSYGGKAVTIRLPPVVCRFIVSFDCGELVTPFSVELDIPGQFLPELVTA